MFPLIHKHNTENARESGSKWARLSLVYILWMILLDDAVFAEHFLNFFQSHGHLFVCM